MEVGKKGKVHVEDIVFLIRKDPKKYARVKVRIKALMNNNYLFPTNIWGKSNVMKKTFLGCKHSC